MDEDERLLCLPSPLVQARGATLWTTLRGHHRRHRRDAPIPLVTRPAMPQNVRWCVPREIALAAASLALLVVGCGGRPDSRRGGTPRSVASRSAAGRHSRHARIRLARWSRPSPAVLCCMLGRLAWRNGSVRGRLEPYRDPEVGLLGRHVVRGPTSSRHPGRHVLLAPSRR